MMVSGEVDPGQGGTIWALNLDEPAPVITPLVAATFRQVGRESALALGTALGGDTTGEVLRRFETGSLDASLWSAWFLKPEHQVQLLFTPAR